MKRKIVAYTLFSILGLGILGGVASARGFGGFGGPGFMVKIAGGTPEEIVAHHAEMFQHQAEIFGLSVQEVKDAWADGKNLFEVAKAKGITAEEIQKRMEEKHKAEMRARLQTLADKGVISQDQMNRHLAVMETRAGKMGGKKIIHRGFGGF